MPLTGLAEVVEPEFAGLEFGEFDDLIIGGAICNALASAALSSFAKGFVVEPMRWIVERTIGWLGRCRRLAKDWENRNHNALSFLQLASIRRNWGKIVGGV